MDRIARTKKVRSKRVSKKEIWDKFADAVGDAGLGIGAEVECVYDKAAGDAGERSSCECCGGGLVTGEEGFLTCTNAACGVIYKDKLFQGAEWRYYGADGTNPDPARAGAPINELLRESSYGCRVLCPRVGTYEMRKIRRYTEWQSMPYKEKALYEEFQRISALGRQAGLPKMLIDEAFRYHKRLSEARTFRGLNRDGIIAASIYVAARTNDCPRTPKEIAQIFNLDNSSATRGCKNAVSIINTLECESDEGLQTKLCDTTPAAFIERYCSKLGLTPDLTRLCSFIAIRIQQNNLVPENTPCAIAAGVIYFVSQVCSIALSKRNIHQVSSISEVTINKCYRKLQSLQSILVPRAIIEQYGEPEDQEEEQELETG